MNSLDAPPNPQETISPLLSLPVEILQYTLDLVHDAEPHRLRCLRNSTITTTAPVSLANKQLRGECIASLLRSAPVFEAYVRDFDFRNVVTFLNRLSERELDSFKSKGSQTNNQKRDWSDYRPAIERSVHAYPREKHMNIVLDFTPACSWTLDDLQPWLRRTQHPTKKGAKIEFQYAVRSNAGLENWKGRAAWLQVAHGVERLGGEGVVAELTKVATAIKVARGIGYGDLLSK